MNHYLENDAVISDCGKLGMDGFALAQLRTVAIEQIEPLFAALRPFAEFAGTVEQFVEDRSADGGPTIMAPTSHFRLADFKRAKAVSS